MFAIFARPKPCRILLELRNTDTTWHLSKLAKTTDTTYVYVTKLVTKLQEKEVLMVESKGKKRLVKLTEKGVKIANAINELMHSCE